MSCHVWKASMLGLLEFPINQQLPSLMQSSFPRVILLCLYTETQHQKKPEGPTPLAPNPINWKPHPQKPNSRSQSQNTTNEQKSEKKYKKWPREEKYSLAPTIITVMIANNTASTVACTIFIIYGSSMMLHPVQIWYCNLSKFTPPDKHSQSDKNFSCVRDRQRGLWDLYTTQLCEIWFWVLGFGLS